MALLIALLTFVTIVTLVMFFASKAGERGRLAAERLARFGAQRTHSAYRAEVEKSLAARLVRPMLSEGSRRLPGALHRRRKGRRSAVASLKPATLGGFRRWSLSPSKLLLMVGIRGY